MRLVGYGHLHRHFNLAVFEPQFPARVAPVGKVLALPGAAHLAVPENVAPSSDATALEHVLFALKHEGVDLQVLAGVLPQIPAAEMQQAIAAKPGGAYVRKACYLWEHFNNLTLNLQRHVEGAVVDLFDSGKYLTVSGPVNNPWRVHFNGLGTLDYCPTVQLTPEISKLLKDDIFGRVREFVKNTDQSVLDRAILWAYLSETEGSFSIENEVPSASKKERFVQLLQRAHEARAIDEAYLVELQNITVDSPWDKAVEFRSQQNRLRNGRSVTYVPPPAVLSASLMRSLMQIANEYPQKIHPIVAASILSFGFVFIHPFMDGNGRISRFLFHKALCDSGQLPKGLLLPVSVAMKKHENDYLAALNSFSKPARQQWTVEDYGNGEYGETFNGQDAIYRYWDATSCVEFGLKMANQALEHHLVSEVQTLRIYDHIKQAIDEEFDVRNDHLSLVIFNCIDNEGIVSKNLRKKLAGQLGAGLEDRIEQLLAEQKKPRTDAAIPGEEPASPHGS